MMFRCISIKEVGFIMKEVHEGVCESHIGGRALSGKILRAEYYWPSMLQEFARFLNRCEKCQIYAPFIDSHVELLHSVISLWHFYHWGSNILSPFPLAIGQLKFLLVAVDYFNKWLDAEAVSWITLERVRHFYWRNIIFHFGLPGIIVSDNDI